VPTSHECFYIWADRLDVQSAFSTCLSEYGFNIYPVFVVDLLHEFELGVWKAMLTHLLRVLYAQGDDRIQTLNLRQVPSCCKQHGTHVAYQVPTSFNIRPWYYQAIREQCLGNEETCRTRFRRYLTGDFDSVLS
jgi:hypothetical protein